MGNEQSVQSPRTPRKLSKPRTNAASNSTTNLLNLKASVSPIRLNPELTIGANRYSFAELEKNEGKEATQKKGMSMFSSKSGQPKSEPLQINTGLDIQYLDRSPVENWLARGSITHESPEQPYFAAPVESRPPVRTARMSLQHDPYAQHHTRLSLVAQAPFPQLDQREPSKRTSYIKIEQAESKRRSQYIQEGESPQHATGLPERTNLEPELFAPIRRRSLLQHGIATRMSWAENDPRQSLPSQRQSQKPQDDLRNYYYNPEKPTSSPLSNIAALGSRIENISPGPRTMTPNDLDYGHTGAYKLGSLRITNGAASPSPSLDRPASQGSDEGYFVDGRGSTNSDRATGQRSNKIAASQETVRSPWITRAESPLRQRQVQEPAEKPLRVNTHLPLPEFSAFNFNAASPARSQDLADKYMQDLALSPFSFDNSPPRTPGLKTTSKHTAMEDDLFEAEPGTPDTQRMRMPRSFDSGYDDDLQQKDRQSVKGPRDLAPKPLAKADSGYSSNVSLRSFKGNATPVVPAKKAPPKPPKEPVSRVSSSAYSMTSSYSEASEKTLRSNRSLPALPTEDLPAPFRQTLPVSLKHYSVQVSGKVIPAPPLPNKSPEQEWAAASLRANVAMTPKHVHQKSMPASITQSFRDESAPGHSPSGSTLFSSSNSTSRWRKDKKRPQSTQPQTQPVYTVQAFRTASEELSIPPIPATVSRHLEERVDGFPLACIPNTLASSNNPRRAISKETLGTIFSVGSAEYREVLTMERLNNALPHTPILEHPTPKSEASRRYMYEPSSPAAPQPVSQTKQRKSHRQSLQSIPVKAAPQSQQAFENHLTSYENVSSSISKSSSDIALGSMTKRPTAQEHAKSVTSRLEAESRERFARAPSVSQESSRFVQRRASYDSIANQNPFASSTSRFRQVSGSKPPPQAHAKWSGLGIQTSSPGSRFLVQQRSNPNFADDGRRLSMQSQECVKSPPPVSMQMWHKLDRTETGSHVVVPPSHTAPPSARDRTPLQPPPHFSPSPKNQDQWASQKGYWAERRKSADGALQGQRSRELKRPESARQSVEYGRKQELKGRVSWDVSQQQGQWEEYGRSSQYNHTHDSYHYPNDANKENWNYQHPQPLSSHPYQPQHHPQYPQKQEDYYDGPSIDSSIYDEEELPKKIHRRQTITSEMLVLDRFSGGLDYGYEPGVGLGGSAGTRNTGKMAAGRQKSVEAIMRYGVDLTDVPVLLQSVKA